MAASPVKLPDALLARRRKIEAENKDDLPVDDTPPANPEDDVAPAKAEPKTPPAEPPSPSPAPEDDDVDLGEEFTDFLSTYGHDDKPTADPNPAADTLARERAEIARQQQELREQREQLKMEREQLARDKNGGQTPKVTAGDLSEDEQRKYAGSKKFITETALAAVGAQVNPIFEDISARLAKLESGFTETRETVQKTAKEAQRMTDVAFNQALQRDIGNATTLFRDPRFVQFLKRKVPYSPNLTFRSLVDQAVTDRNPEPIVQIARAFAKVEEAAGRQVDAMRSAPATPGTGPQNELRNKRPSGKLPWSERQKAWDAYRSGGLSREKFLEVKAKYEQADAQGLIDYDS